MGSGQKLHGSVLQFYVIQGEPTADQVGGETLPVGIVLVPEYRASVVRRFEECLVMEELDIGAEYILDDIENRIVVHESMEVDVTL